MTGMFSLLFTAYCANNEPETNRILFCSATGSAHEAVVNKYISINLALCN